MDRIAIIGSCVTRDVWRVLGVEPDNLLFISRTSLASLAHQPPRATVNMAEIDMPCEFVRRCFEHENDGTTLAAIREFQPDVLLLDFMDERFDLIQLGHSYLTYSEPVAASGLLNRLPPHRVIDRLSIEARMLWTTSAARFIRWVRSELPQTRHILHAAPWATKQIFGKAMGEPPHPSDLEQTITRHRSGLLADYAALIDWQRSTYQILAPEVTVIATDRRLHIAARDHVWGPAPFHYINEYYQALASILCAEGIDIGIAGYERVTSQSSRAFLP